MILVAGAVALRNQDHETGLRGLARAIACPRGAFMAAMAQDPRPRDKTDRGQSRFRMLSPRPVNIARIGSPRPGVACRAVERLT